MSPGRTFALLTLLVTGAAAAQDRPEREVVELRSAALVQLSGDVREVTGGAWVSDPTMIDIARELVGLRAEVHVLREAPPAPPLAVIYAAGVALAVGIGLGILAGRELPR